MKRNKVVTAVVVLLYAGCSRQPERPLLPDADTYRTWGTTTERVLNEPIPGHGPGLRKIFINAAGMDARRNLDEPTTYPDGTIVIKEVYDSPNPEEGTEPAMITAMVKDGTNEASSGGWLWIVRQPPDGEEKIISAEFCMTCHSNANEEHPYADGNRHRVFRDYLFY